VISWPNHPINSRKSLSRQACVNVILVSFATNLAPELYASRVTQTGIWARGVEGEEEWFHVTRKKKQLKIDEE
jgi:hypothetical protein